MQFEGTIWLSIILKKKFVIIIEALPLRLPVRECLHICEGGSSAREFLENNNK